MKTFNEIKKLAEADIPWEGRTKDQVYTKEDMESIIEHQSAIGQRLRNLKDRIHLGNNVEFAKYLNNVKSMNAKLGQSISELENFLEPYWDL